MLISGFKATSIWKAFFLNSLILAIVAVGAVESKAYVEKLGWNVELISDEFNSTTLQKEFETVKIEKSDKGTHIIAGKQVVDNIVCNYTWVKITKI